MAVIAEDAFFRLPAADLLRANGVLLYGSDEGLVSSSRRRLAQSWTGGEEPLVLTAATLRADPAALEEAFRGLSLFGGRRLIVVEGVDEQHLQLLQRMLTAEEPANFLALCAGSLNKSSSLRAAAEASRRFYCIAFHEEADSELAARVTRILQEDGLAIETEGARRLVELCGSDRGLLVGEAAKLALHYRDARRITLPDVEALCGDASVFDAAELAAAMLAGDVAGAETALAAARDTGDSGQVLNALKWQIDRLHAVRLAYEHSGNLEQAFSRARPPIHFKAKDQLRGLLSRVTGDQLDGLQRRMQEAILSARMLAPAAAALSERFVLAVARDMRAARR